MCLHSSRFLLYREPMPKLLPVVILTLATSPALAGATPWQELAPGVKARMISSDSVGQGTTMVGLELDMPRTTETYWRIPGETGIPTEFDFSGTTGLSDPAVQWPYPEIDLSRGYRDYVFHGHVVLPVKFKTDSGAATLQAAVTLGVCSDLCVPAQAKFSLPLSFAKSDPEQSSRLEIAMAGTPIEWDQPQEPFGRIAATADGLTIAGIDDAIDPATIIADVGDLVVLFSAPQKSPDGQLWTLKFLGDSGAKGLAGRTVQLTFMTRSGPYAVSREIAAAT
jgi:DsbC/DsbD-like thiol-disulfide interchange protein